MKLPADCPYAISPLDRLAGDPPSRVACCRRWWPSFFSEAQLDDLTREILKTIKPDSENIEATVGDAAVERAACMWAKPKFLLRIDACH
jgi:hypothetical protein